MNGLTKEETYKKETQKLSKEYWESRIKLCILGYQSDGGGPVKDINIQTDDEGRVISLEII